MHPRIKAVFVSCCCIGGILVSQDALADVVVTKSGRRYEGNVTQTDSSYVIQRADGKKIALPKSLVKEHVTSDGMLDTYERARGRADLNNDKHVQKLLDYTIKHGLVDARAALLQDLYALRLAQAQDDRQKLQDLLDWCRKHKLSKQEKECARLLSKLEYKERQATAGENAVELAKLAIWCEEKGLDDEGRAAVTAALLIAPEDEKVRELLGYERVPDQGWRKRVSPWQVQVVQATLQAEYSELQGAARIYYLPKQGVVASVEVEFEALTPDADALALRDQLKDKLGKEAWELFRRERKNANEPSRMFVSTNAILKLTNGDSLAPGFTSQPNGSGETFTNSTVNLTVSADQSTAVIGYTRVENLTAIIMKPKIKERLTLMYPVPPGTQKATLHFYDLAPLEVKFK